MRMSKGDDKQGKNEHKNENIRGVFINHGAEQRLGFLLNKDWDLKRLSLDKNLHNIYVITIKEGDGKEEGGKYTKNSGYIAKVYKSNREEDMVHTEKVATTETEALMKLKDVKGVPRLLACFISPEFSYSIMTEIKGKDLFEYVKEKGPFSENGLRKISFNILKVLKDIHSKKIVHYDIKPENIMYNEQSGEVHIIDFEGRYTKAYRSKDKTITCKADMWSFGATVLWLLTTRDVYVQQGEVDVQNMCLGYTCSSSFKDFLECLLDSDYTTRYSATEALNHCWFDV
jgi:serine/threonine protein kinase